MFWHISNPHCRMSDTETWLRYSWICCSFHCWVFPGLWLMFWHNWDLAIQSRVRLLDVYETTLPLILDVSFKQRYASRATNTAPDRMYCSLRCTLYYSLLNWHHVFFDFVSMDAVLTECDLSIHFMFWCRQLIPLVLCWYINLCLIGMWRPPLKCVQLSAPCQFMSWRKVTL